VYDPEEEASQRDVLDGHEERPVADIACGGPVNARPNSLSTASPRWLFLRTAPGPGAFSVCPDFARQSGFIDSDPTTARRHFFCYWAAIGARVFIALRAIGALH
jgi:hypothetical protein